MYLIDGFCKDELMQKMLQYFMDIAPEEMPKDAHEMSKKCIPYVCTIRYIISKLASVPSSLFK